MKPLDPVDVKLSGTVLIEASAGTGKTYTIATLFLRLLLERRLDVSQILVVTYTRAATAELRDRIRRRISEAVAAIDGDARDDNLTRLFATRAREGQLASDRALLLQALRDFDQAAIFTIHAFCQHTLSECAFESRTPFELELSEDQTPLLREVALDYYAHLAYGAERELLARLRDKRIGPDQLAQLTAKVVREPHMPVLPEAPAEAALDTTAFYAARDRAAHLWAAEREPILVLLENAGLSKQSYKPERMRKEWARELDALGGRHPGALPKCLPKLSQRELTRAAKRKAAPTHAFFDAVDVLCAHDAQLTQVLEDRVLSLRRRVVDYARSEVERRRREQGVHSFDDLLQKLDAALRGTSGDVLAARVATRHPAALIDEFQDTDPIQYGIFRRIYQQEQRDRACSLFLIGDPKQAIYGFRGADVFAYMHAARSCSAAAYTLDVNYRTDPRLVQAVGTLFGSAHRPFLFPEIQFEKVRPKPDARERLSPSGPALQLLFVPRNAHTAEKKNAINKGWGGKHLPQLVAYEILHLLHSGATIEGAKVAPRDVAVLCRTNAQAKATQAALASLGVPSVLEGDSSVFDSEAAEELSRVLWAVAQPADTRKLGAALATAILGVSGEDLHRMREDEAGLEPWLDRFARWNQTWHERGFVQMLQRVIDEVAVQPRLLSRSDGERRLTDLLHVSELLHQASVQQHLGPLALLHWFSQMRSDPAARAGLVAESEQMRLEHDEHALRLTTVHRSKGLEYPVVFCPFAWSAFSGRDTEVRFHDRDDEDRLKLDLGSPAFQAHRQAAQREDLAESLRLLYVALTRAMHRCYVVWGRFNKNGASPLAYLLHSTPATQGDPTEVEARLSKLLDGELRAELGALCAASEDSIGLRDIRFDQPPPYTPVEHAAGELRPRVATRTHSKSARMTSFSRLTADAAEAATHVLVDGTPDHDASASEAFPRELETPARAEKVTLAGFPSGARPGSLIHGVYEHIDFQREDAAELGAQAERFLALYGVDVAHRDALVRGIAESLTTPLDAGHATLTLAEIARADRVNELEFTLCTTPGALCAEHLADALQRHRAPACDPDYGERLRALGFVPQAGYLKGFVDLVFRHGGRFYVADYKSNWLGDHAHDYRAERMASAMREHHYYLQYHLYVVALHRYLGARLSDYDYDLHMGGVFYLFVRGMSPAHPRGSGVFFDRPARALIEALADALERPANAAQAAPESSA